MPRERSAMRDPARTTSWKVARASVRRIVGLRISKSNERDRSKVSVNPVDRSKSPYNTARAILDPVTTTPWKLVASLETRERAYFILVFLRP